MARVTLTVSEEERRALVELAKVQLRDPRAQATLILRRALEQSGYLASIDGRATIDNGGGQEPAQHTTPKEVTR